MKKHCKIEWVSLVRQKKIEKNYRNHGKTVAEYEKRWRKIKNDGESLSFEFL